MTTTESAETASGGPRDGDHAGRAARGSRRTPVARARPLGNTAGSASIAFGIPIGLRPRREGRPATYQTTVPNATRSATSSASALAATRWQGRLRRHAFGLNCKKPLTSVLPTGIYTIPEISQVGRTEQDCRREGIPYVNGRSRYDQGRGPIIGDTGHDQTDRPRDDVLASM